MNPQTYMDMHKNLSKGLEGWAETIATATNEKPFLVKELNQLELNFMQNNKTAGKRLACMHRHGVKGYEITKTQKTRNGVVWQIVKKDENEKKENQKAYIVQADNGDLRAFATYESAKEAMHEADRKNVDVKRWIAVLELEGEL